MPTSEKLKREIETVLLEHFNGEVYDANGLTTRKIFQYISGAKSIAQVSSALTEMDEEDRVHRDQPNQRRTTRVALPEHSSHPPVKAVPVMVEQSVREIGEMLEQSVNALVDNRVEAGIHEYKKKIREEEQKKVAEEVDLLRSEVKSLRSKLTSGTAPIQSQVEQLEAELAETREKLRIAEHNVGVWKRQAMGRANVQEMFTSVKDRLPDHMKRELEKVMRELPAER